MPKLNFSFFVAASLAFLPVSTSNGQSSGSSAKGVDVYDGFETSKLSRLWESERFEPGAVMMQTNIVRTGHGAARVVVHTHDKFEAGLNGNNDSERDELLEARKLVAREGVNYEQSFSMFFPTNFPVVPTRLVIAQWKQYCGGDDKPCSDDSPVLAVRYIGGELRITQDINKKRNVLFREKGEFRGRWLDFRFQVRFSSGDNGRIKAWLDHRQLLEYQGVTANPENAATGYPSPSHFYFKMGLYRNVMAEPMTVYIDEYRKKELAADAF